MLSRSVVLWCSWYLTSPLRLRVVNGDLANMTHADGWDGWRQREADSLADLVRRRIDYLQNPPDCATAKKVVCNLNKVRHPSVLCLWRRVWSHLPRVR